MYVHDILGAGQSNENTEKKNFKGNAIDISLSGSDIVLYVLCFLLPGVGFQWKAKDCPPYLSTGTIDQLVRR